MKKALILLFVFTSTTSFAQRIHRSVIGSAGKVMSAANGKLSFTLGEAVAHKIQSPATLLALNQGFQQRLLTGTALPVTGLIFSASRTNATQVSLQWKTVQEIDNKGFYIERKNDNETSFTGIRWVNSATADGNSQTEQTYRFTDLNAHKGYAYYRLRQEDRNGRFAYSLIRTVAGTATDAVQLQVWPIPSSGPVQVRVAGLLQPDAYEVYDMNGRRVQQYAAIPNQTTTIRVAAKGMYVIRLAKAPDIKQTFIVQ